jgi:hypothetical protein
LGGPRFQSQESGEEINSFYLPGFEAQFLYSKTCALVTMLTELPRFLKCQYIVTLFRSI